MTDGIEEMPMIKIVKGIQNHTRPIAAPVIIEAVGTTPILRGGDATACSRWRRSAPCWHLDSCR